MIKVNALRKYDYVVDPTGKFGTHRTIGDAIDAALQANPDIIQSPLETCYILVLPGIYDERLKIDYG